MKGESSGAGAVIWSFITLCIGGVILGCLVGFITSHWIKSLFNDEVLVVNLTFICGYVAFFLAEFSNIGI